MYFRSMVKFNVFCNHIQFFLFIIIHNSLIVILSDDENLPNYFKKYPLSLLSV